jgi:ATP-dependent Lon protease
VVQITKENITEYLGQPIQTPKQHGKLMPGVAIGLGDSYYGGRLTYIEAKKRSFNKNASAARMLFLTGSLQNVFKESAEIGYTFARNFLQEKLNNTYLYQN